MELVSLEQRDMGLLLELLNEPGVRSKLVRDSAVLRESDIQTLLYGPDPNRIRTFGLRQDGEIAGVISLYDIDWISRTGTFGNLAVKNPWHGVMAARLLLDYAFDDLGLHRVDCRVWEDNEMTPLICKRIGATEEAVIREAVFRDGRWINLTIYSMLDREWKPHVAAA